MADELYVLNFYYSPYGMRVKIALAGKEIEHENKEEDVWSKSQLLLDMNPVHKKIPVLVHNGKSICESLIIVEYIDEVWKDKSPLLPSDPYQKAHARFWADFIDKKVSDPARRIWMKKGEELEVAKKEFIELLKMFEEELGDKAYFGGETFGLVDVTLISFYTWFEAYEICGNFSIEEHCPKLITWAKRCMERDSVHKSLADPNKICEYIVVLQKKYGVA